MSVVTVSDIGNEVDFQIAQGADFSYVLTVLNANGSPHDLTGATVTAVIKKSAVSSIVLQSFTTALSVTPTDGTVTLSLTAANNTLPAGSTLEDTEGQYVWDMKVVTRAGAVLRPFYGNVSMWRGVSP